MGDFSQQVMEALAGLGGDISTFMKNADGRFKSIQDEQTAVRQIFNELRQEVATKGAHLVGGDFSARGDSAGARFVKAFDFDGYKKSGKQRVEIGRLWKKAITTAEVGRRQAAGVAPVAFAPLRVRQLIGEQPTASSSIDYARLSAYANAADIVAEGAQKPESNASFLPVNAPIVTIAHWVHGSKQAIADQPQLQNLVDTLLMWGVELRTEHYLLNHAADGINTLAPAVATPSGTAVDRVRAAIGQVENAGWNVTASVLNAADWEAMEISKDTQGRYILPGVPSAAAAPTLWNKPVIVSPVQPAGTALVGDFATGAVIFNREDASVLVSDEDRDNFVKNLVTILCETRLVLALQVPGAFRKVALV
jgi:HK97 family phage major capsid protein